METKQESEKDDTSVQQTSDVHRQQVSALLNKNHKHGEHDTNMQRTSNIRRQQGSALLNNEHEAQRA